ncbi:acyl transferase domain-containing protein [Saccharothrix carnea]|uniref:Acyl transferase domain-containing protein n=1 Tax=Saccharothrix carnea TaxID=1280637 RepID=A0A2P8IBF8_SACCR|nr:type I polyketide synthase [Saccharothrix carnea]PSL55783.1 acyl transferase domain-containing protein [Saccharothrix carnea]
MPENKAVKRRETGLEIAVIGMAGRFPQAEDIDRFWANLVDGVDAISRFTDDELLEMGVAKATLEDEKYVRAKGVFPNIEYFDADFFNYTPADATLLDPQVRALHEEVFHALEDAGYSAEGRSEAIGLFLGATNNLAWETHTLTRHILESGMTFTGLQLNDKDFAATRIAYALDLKGPAFTMHSACSTSLVAIDMACRNLWTGSCQIALAGGSGLTLPHKNGYRYQENMIHSPDGHTRPFDKDSGGTVEGNGVGIVVLKRLETALRDGDRVYAVIKGSAVNNDGNRKVGYTAPSIEGQAEVIRKAYRVAGVPTAEVSYVETHGTGTSLGDPIEVEALRKAFGAGEPGGTGLGSLKASIGHLDTGAGVASLIKTCKILEHRTVPRSLHFTELNPNIDLDGSPFYVVAENQELRPKRSAADEVLPLRAGVSSFGIGGSNAHVVLEEAPAGPPASTKGRAHNTFLVSATSADAIRRIKQHFVDHLTAHPDVDGSDLAWTLQNRQRRLAYRYAVEFKDAEQLRERLQESLDDDEPPAQVHKNARGDVYFLFSGLGAQHLRMARDLYEKEAAFRAHLDECFAISTALGSEVPREVFFGDSPEAEKQLNNIEITQVLLFMLETSMARTLIGWGLKPKGMVGHSTGELAAACVSGVFSLEDGIRLVQARGSLMDTTVEGALTSVRAPEDVVRTMLTDELAIAAVNGPEDCTVSGMPAAIAELERQCTEREIKFAHIEADHAYHSQYMDSMLGRFREVLDGVTLHQPKIPYLSNVTGTWITAAQSTDRDYYCKHARETVRFKDGVEAILERGGTLFVEVGPGKSLSSFVRAIGRDADVTTVNVLRHRMEEIGDDEHLARAVKKLWENGVSLDWKAFHKGREPRKVKLPLYPFEKVEFPVDIEEFQRMLDGPGDGSTRVVTARPARQTVTGTVTAAPAAASRLTWARSVHPASTGKEQPKVLVVLTDDRRRVKRVLDEVPHWRALYVTSGPRYRFDRLSGAVVRPGDADDLRRLVADLEDHALAGDTFVVDRADYASAVATVRGLCAVIPDMRERCVKDVVVLDTGDFLGTRGDFLPLLIGVNHEHPEFRVRAVRCDAALADGGGREAWRESLRRELEAHRPDDVAVRYERGQRLVPRMVPLDGGGTAAGGAVRTVVLSRRRDVEDVVRDLAGASLTRTVDILPFDLGTGGPQTRVGAVDERISVLPAVVGSTWEALSAKLPTGLRILQGVDEVVLWDTPVREGDDAGLDRRALLGLLAELGRERRIPCHVLSRPGLDRGGWDREVTTWFADNERADAAGLTRLYAFGNVREDDRSVLDLLPRLREAGIGTAFHGLDLLRAQAEAKVVDVEVETDRGDERQAIAAVIEREIRALLGFSEIDDRADIFDIGLDSVRLVQFTNALEKNGYKVLANEVYNHPTVAGLAAYIERTVRRGGSEEMSFESLATVLEQRLGTPCAFREVKSGRDEDTLVVLFVTGLDDALKKKVVREFSELRVPAEYLPHYVVPGGGEELGMALDFAALKASAGLPSYAGGYSAVFDEIDRKQEELRRSIGSRPVKWTYPISAMQKQHFATESRLQLYLIQFRELVDLDVLQRALCDVIGRHGLMRSFLTRSTGRFRWKEFEAPETIALPTLDLSGLEPHEQEELRTELVKREWNMDFKVVDKPMYQVVLIKYNDRSHDLLFQFDHSIFDHASGQLFRGDLLKRYEELAAGTSRAMPIAKSYRHLQDQIAKGPVDITSDELIEKFDLVEYVRYAKIIQEKSARFADSRIRDVRYSVDLDRLRAADGTEVDLFYVVVHLYARVVARLLGIDKVALIMLFQSRVFEDKDYSEVMGMVLGSLPVLVPGERDTMRDLDGIITDKVRMMNKNNVSFLNLIQNLRSIVKHRKVLSVMGKTLRPTCLLNFVGNVEDEYDAIWDMTLAQLTDDQSKLDYADCYGVSKVGNGRLDLLVLSKWVEDPDDLVRILDDEVEHLTGRVGAE